MPSEIINEEIKAATKAETDQKANRKNQTIKLRLKRKQNRR